MEQQIQIKAEDKILRGVYCNTMQVAHTKEEFILDFINIVPPAGQFVSRVITSPAHLKRIVNALKTNLELYEKSFGVIKESEQPDERKIGFRTD